MSLLAAQMHVVSVEEVGALALLVIATDKKT